MSSCIHGKVAEVQLVQHGQERLPWRSDVEPQPTGWGGVIQAKGIMNKQRSRPVQKACCLNSEIRRVWCRLRWVGLDLRLANPCGIFFSLPRQREVLWVFEARELGSRWWGDTKQFAFLKGQVVRGWGGWGSLGRSYLSYLGRRPREGQQQQE